MEKEANIIKLLASPNNLQNSIVIENKNYHIYVINSEEIKEDDWYMYCHFGEWIISNSRETLKNKTNTLENLNKDDYFKKIIATTDFELRTPDSGMKAGYYMKDSIPLPRPSDDFIKAFVKAHGKIDKVLVEYDYKFSTISEGKPGFPEDDISWWNYKLKVSSDNTVTIRAFEKEKRSINDVHKECLNYLLTQIEKPADPMNNLVSFNAAQMALNLMVSEIKLGRVKI